MYRDSDVTVSASTPSEGGESALVIGSISYGETAEDVEYTDGVLQTVIRACQDARWNAESPRDARAALREVLLGCATMLGLAPRPGAAVEALHSALVRARDAEGEESERILTGGGSKQSASVHSGRRGVLDTARYEMEQAVEQLQKLEVEQAAWERRREGRREHRHAP